ncbi:pyrimidine 5'-nucleotidase [Phenylobacterium immobile]|uniref:pyrimidine 5'-nucleotidase n=1 Tax=Phenylobacterium immobile TaxID=21 RepID=UPI000B046499|nr:pyrimidine 5'-nucleotidase [Phenylobacterium immobile]
MSVTEGVDLSGVDAWLFDLDNTLYPVESGFLDEAVSRMTTYVQKVTGLPRDEAFALQKRYLREHGLTLRGMMLDWGVDPDDYHAMFHDLSLEALAHDPALLAAIERLPGKRLIFTNADAVSAERVLKRLGLAHLFEDVFHIASAEFLPKPAPETFDKIVWAHNLDATRTCFFEDTERNLQPAHKLGMTTVLVGAHAAASTAAFVDHRTDSLAAFLAAARLKETL